VTDVNTIVKPSKPREEIKETEQDWLVFENCSEG
jgi:hypothetical protein